MSNKVESLCSVPVRAHLVSPV
uniref:Uncharacterized protein n=1 Tax=Arundo donax TaxID=35708 RepID=A0A0A9ERY8_ARUDO